MDKLPILTIHGLEPADRVYFEQEISKGAVPSDTRVEPQKTGAESFGMFVPWDIVIKVSAGAAVSIAKWIWKTRKSEPATFEFEVTHPDGTVVKGKLSNASASSLDGLLPIIAKDLKLNEKEVLLASKDIPD